MKKLLLLLCGSFCIQIIYAGDKDISLLEEGDRGIGIVLVTDPSGGHEYERSDLYPLHTAVKSGNIQRVERLLMAGYPIDELNSILFTPLMYAVFSDNGDMVNSLLQHGAEINKSNGFATALYCAMYCSGSKARKPLQRLDIINLLLQRGAEISYRNQYGRTALYEAIKQLPDCHDTNDKQLQLDIIRFLLQEGADPDIKDDSGKNCRDLAKEVSIDADKRRILEAMIASRGKCFQ